MITLGDIAGASGGWVSPVSAARSVSDCVIDSRMAGEGSLFFALKGAHADGHDYVEDVLRRNGMAVVSRGGEREGTVVVRSVENALLDAAGWRRSTIGCRVLAVTGSSGKTTTRRLLTAALECRFRVYGTPGNLNNHLGLPLVILNAPEKDPDVMVLEMGMNHPGELLVLGRAARPTDCLITSIGRAHMEFFGSLDEVAGAKSELISSTEPEGYCVIPAGQGILERAAMRRGLRTRFFGEGGDAWIEIGDDGVCTLHPWMVPVKLSLRGRHNCVNAAAAALMASLLGVPPEASAAAMSLVQPSGGRGRIVRTGGLVIMDESYNANPDSTLACLDVLDRTSGRKAAVLGDMRELGEKGPEFHREILRKADALGLELLILTGSIYGSVAEEVRGTEVLVATDWKEALILLRERLRGQCTVLVKGSNSLRLGELVRSLEEGD
ncbi:MAG: UDP-N-acetylmuramoyl-tripeptide--D-alanyl-D-alanine ligase [Candidatus Fermentibacteraceae bacterium]|nr:UDP-N-acetylmuramoyl-tripeptide--D-alanyl-D-alanine ligase [Candidatus Fermentibacteraceae bacterium]MBN2609736.1 UDP-N-acetylmuramoyl-tripeptide--D-alanyl-D-alanine ligase [Candidatus Fermentibacteraceae bacterium]